MFSCAALDARPMFLAVARIVYQETKNSRRQLHAVRGTLSCDATFSLGEGYWVDGSCPCIDEYSSVLLSVLGYLRNLDPVEVRSYGALARAHCQLRAVPDAQRQRRGRQGALQKPEQVRRGVIGRALGTGEQQELLVDLAAEAGSCAPLEDDDHLVRRLASLRAARVGGTAAEHIAAVRRDRDLVRIVADRRGKRKRDSYGELVSWWEFHIETGLGRRERPGAIPTHAVRGEIGAVPAADDGGDCDDCDGGGGGGGGADVVAEVRSAGGRPTEIIARLRDLVRTGRIPVEVLHDRLRLAVVVAAAQQLGGAGVVATVSP